LEQLQSESNRLFEMIASLERTVVFFDEFDEMVRERTSERADLMSRFLTTAMLPKLSRIADKRQIVFLLATNHIEDFDFAISRPGRFDMLLPVMPPSLDAKLNALKWQSIKPAIIPLLDEEMTCFDGETTLPIREVLEALTFAEYKALYSKSKELTDPDQLRGQVAAAWDRATLNKPSYGVPNETREASGLLYRFYLSQAKEHSRVLKPKIN
jgi:SpoVK/Ycf46/Vps4 family AAA+-type ATPase